MRKLTKDQQKIVEDNHNLIYSFIHSRGLDVDEYYGLVAESLCKAVLNWDKPKGELSTLFYTIANNDLNHQWRKGLAGKRQHEGLLPMEDWGAVDEYDLENEVLTKIAIEDIENSEFKEIVELRILGYTQSEIGEMLGISQVTVSRKLKKVGEKYFDRKG